MERIISPIAIDLGSKNTGVYSSTYSPGDNLADIKSNGCLITIQKNSKSWQLTARTSNRHARRGRKRRELAKRLLSLILKYKFDINTCKNLRKNEKIYEVINSFLNRRGFTYLTEDIDDNLIESVDDEVCKKLFSLKDESLLDKFKKLSTDPSKAKEFLYEFDFNGKKKINEKLNKLEKDGLDFDKKEAATGIHMFFEGIRNVVHSDVDGHHPRKKYFENISIDIERLSKEDPDCKEIIFNKIDHVALSNLIGNISNLQLKVLRKYFNDKSKRVNLELDEKRLSEFIRKWVKSWHPEKEDKERYHELQKSIKESSSIVDFMCETKPEKTIPPYEDQNNRRPPKCQSLILNESKLDDLYSGWRGIAQSFLTFDESLNNGLNSSDYSRILQRAFERKRSSDPLKFHFCMKELENGRNNSKYPNEMLKIKKILGKSLTVVQDIYKKFSEEVYEARYGYWDEENNANLLKTCNKNPPHKGNITSILIGSVLGSELNDDDFNLFEEFFKNTKVKGNSTVNSISRKAQDMIKEYRNELKQRHLDALKKEKPSKDEKKLVNLFQDCKKVAEQIGNYLNHESQQWEKYSSPFSLAQLYSHLNDNKHGFSNLCKECAKDSNWRSLTDEKGNANCNRLPALSIRPFDGVVDKIVDSIAWDIVKFKEKELDNFTSRFKKEKFEIRIPILIESNQFSFTEDLFSIKLNVKKSSKDKSKKRGEEYRQKFKDKNERIKSFSGQICPYTGVSIGENGDIDHIISRAVSKKEYGSIFNSEANLIYCSKVGNTNKGIKSYQLKDLHKDFLKKIFDTTDLTLIKDQAVKVVKEILSRKRIINYQNLSDEEQKYLRIGLFIDELKGDIIREINTRNKTIVNGTQKWLAKKIIQKFNLIASKKWKGHKLDFKPYFVDSNVVHELRDELGRSYHLYKKEAGDQSAYSHIIDASMVVAAGMCKKSIVDYLETISFDIDKPDYDALNSLLPKSFQIIQQKNKDITEKSKISGRQILNDSKYAEHFIPILIDNEKKVYFGFNLKNCTEFIGNAEKLLKEVQEFLIYKDNALDMSIDELAHTINKKYCYLKIDKAKAISYLNCILSKNKRKDVKYKVLDSLKYITKREPVENIILDDKKKKLKSIDLNKFKKDKCRKTIKFPKVKELSKDKKCELKNNTIILPFYKNWERLLNNKDMIQIAKSGSSEGLNKFLYNYFKEKDRNDFNKNHSKVRKTFSLPIIPSPPGTFVSIKSETFEKKELWQLHVLNGTTVKFKGVKGDSVYKDKLNIQNQHFVKSRGMAIESDIAEKKIPLSDWFNLELSDDLKKKKIHSLKASLATKGDPRVRLKLSSDAFTSFFKERCNNFPESVLNLKSSLKYESKNKVFDIECLGAPEGTINILGISEETLEIEYRIKGGNSSIRKMIYNAWSKDNEASNC